MTEENIDIIKIIILGSSQVGKTSIINRYIHKNFEEDMLSSIGVDFVPKYFKFGEEKIQVNFIDTAGQERFKSISRNYLKGADGALLVFDITKKDTFDLIQSWIDTINENNNKNIGKIIFGNKSDLSEKRTVSKEEAEELAQNLGLKYYEGSAKTGENIEEVMNEIARKTYEYFKESKDKRKKESVKITKDNHNKEEKKKEMLLTYRIFFLYKYSIFF